MRYQDFIRQFAEDHPGPDLFARAAEAWHMRNARDHDVFAQQSAGGQAEACQIKLATYAMSKMGSREMKNRLSHHGCSEAAEHIKVDKDLSVIKQRCDRRFQELKSNKVSKERLQTELSSMAGCQIYIPMYTKAFSEQTDPVWTAQWVALWDALTRTTIHLMDAIGLAKLDPVKAQPASLNRLMSKVNQAATQLHEHFAKRKSPKALCFCALLVVQPNPVIATNAPTDRLRLR